MHNPASYRHTTHSKVRTNQRGIKADAINAIWSFGDSERPCGNGCFELSISRDEASWLVRKGRLSAQLADKCRRLKLVTNGEILITVYQNDN